MTDRTEEQKAYTRAAVAKHRQKKREAKEAERAKARLIQEKLDIKLGIEAQKADAERILRERQEDVEYFLSGQALKDFPDLTEEEIQSYESQIDLYLRPLEATMDFETLWEYLSVLDPLGRRILNYFNTPVFELDPAKRYHWTSDGIEEIPRTAYPQQEPHFSGAPREMISAVDSENEAGDVRYILHRNLRITAIENAAKRKAHKEAVDKIEAQYILGKAQRSSV